MNQLFDGRGDKTSLAELRQRYVPINSTSMCLGVQPQPFFKALTSIGKTVWMDSGFAERFLFTTVRPFRLIFLIPLWNIPYKYSGEIFSKNIRQNDAFNYVSYSYFIFFKAKYSAEYYKRNLLNWNTVYMLLNIYRNY